MKIVISVKLFVSFVMALNDSSSRLWLGYVTAEVVHQCITLCDEECLACKNNVISPLLHFHNELNLKDKIQRYLGRVTIKLDTLFDQFILRFGWFALNRQRYIELAEIFLSVSTPEAVMYGKYITHQNDFTIYGQEEYTTDVKDYTLLESGDVATTEKKCPKRKAAQKKSKKAKKVKTDHAETPAIKLIEGLS